MYKLSKCPAFTDQLGESSENKLKNDLFEHSPLNVQKLK